MGMPNGQDEIPASAITLAETMQTAGYTTAHFGKYHVGENEADNNDLNAATDQGFDVNFGGGTSGAPGTYFAADSGGGNWTFHGNIGPELDIYAAPYTLAESQALSVNGDNALEGTPKHVTDAMADAAIDFMNANNTSPFFMHFSNYAIHGPFGQSNARPDLYAKYNAKTPSAMGHNNIGQAAIAEGMDQTIGRLIDYLKTTPDPQIPGQMLSENTLVYFISDNGGAIGTDDNGPLRAMKGEYYEGGIRSVTMAWSEATWLANKGTINTTPIIAFDLYPTLVDLAGGTLPSGYDIDGVSQWSMLNGSNSDLGRESIFWHFPGYMIDANRNQYPVSIIRKGDYKLIYNYEDETYELYDLINDISEATNLLSGSPDQATLILGNDMSTDLRQHLIDVSAPLPTYVSDGTAVPLPYIISTTPSGGSSTDGCQATSGYAAYWDFDSVNGANDDSGNGYNPISIVGTVTYDTSDFIEGDQSIVFNGSTEIQYSDGTFLNAATTARTFMAWIKPTALSSTQIIFEEGGTGNGLGVQLNGSSIEVAMTSSVEVNMSISTAYPTDSEWHHVAIVYDGANTSLEIYLDGVLATSTTSALSLLGTHNSPSGIGGVIGGGDAFGNISTGSFFNGKMDAVAVYESVLSMAEIETAACIEIQDSSAGCQAVNTYEAYWDFDIANDANDGSGNAHNPTITPTSITYDEADFVEGDRAIVFDGTEAIQYATNNSSPDTFMNDATSSRTVVVWIKPTVLSGLQDIYDEGGQNVGIAMRLNGSNLESIVRESSTVATTLSTAYSNDGNWHHVALVYDGSINSHKLYLDGVEVASNSSASSSLVTHFSYGGIGGKLSGNDSFQNSSDAYFTGKMDAFAVYNSALSLADIETTACYMSSVVADAGPDVTICDGDSTTLTASGGSTYLWSTGATTASITVNPSIATTYSVTVSDGITSDSDDVEVTVNSLPTADAGSDVTIDEGNSTVLTASGGGTYLWSTGATTASITVSPSATTTYSVTVTLNGCEAIDDVVVTVNPPTGCTYSVINTEGFESGWGIWNDGGSDATRGTNSVYATTGQYSMRLRDNTSTSVGTTDNLDLTAYEELTVDFGYYPRSMDNSNEDFWLQISTDGGSSYTTIEEWNLNDEFVNDQHYTDQVVISGPFTANTQLRFRADASGNQDWVYIDDIVISGCSSSSTAKGGVAETKKSKEVIAADDIISENLIKVYPNPFKDKMNIIIETKVVNQKSTIALFNTLGQQIFEKEFNKNKIEIPAENLQNGIYIIKVHIGNKILTKRLVKKE